MHSFFNPSSFTMHCFFSSVVSFLKDKPGSQRHSLIHGTSMDHLDRQTPSPTASRDDLDDEDDDEQVQDDGERETQTRKKSEDRTSRNPVKAVDNKRKVKD